MTEDLNPLGEARGSRRGAEAETTLEVTDTEMAAVGTATGTEGVTPSVADV
jgi:hypothetical protein